MLFTKQKLNLFMMGTDVSFFVFAWEVAGEYLLRIFVGREADILKCYIAKLFYLCNTDRYVLGHQLQNL